MISLFIDANVYLRFYAYTDDDLLELEKLHALVEAGELRIYKNSQLEDEIERNRENKIDEALNTFKKSIGSAQIPRFALHFEEAKNLLELSKQVQTAKSELTKKIASEIEDGDLRADQLIRQLLKSGTDVAVTSAILERARWRQIRGNPPGKSDSIGDQIHWESLLAGVGDGEDIHIVSHDGDFASQLRSSQPNPKLASEWSMQKHATLFLYQTLGAFAKKHFGSISLPTDVTKSSAISKLVGSANFENTHKQIARLQKIINEITLEEANLIFQALIDNNQIKWIAEDSDVKEFYSELYTKYWSQTDPDMDQNLAEVASYLVPF